MSSMSACTSVSCREEGMSHLTLVCYAKPFVAVASHVVIDRVPYWPWHNEECLCQGPREVQITCYLQVRILLSVKATPYIHHGAPGTATQALHAIQGCALLAAAACECAGHRRIQRQPETFHEHSGEV